MSGNLPGPSSQGNAPQEFRSIKNTEEPDVVEGGGFLYRLIQQNRSDYKCMHGKCKVIIIVGQNNLIRGRFHDHVKECVETARGRLQGQLNDQQEQIDGLRTQLQQQAAQLQQLLNKQMPTGTDIEVFSFGGTSKWIIDNSKPTDNSESSEREKVETVTLNWLKNDGIHHVPLVVKLPNGDIGEKIKKSSRWNPCQLRHI